VPLPQPVTTTYSYRLLRKIHTAAFSIDILQSRRFGELELNADGYADLFDAEVNESCTSMRCYGQVVIAVSSMTAGTYRTRCAKPSSSIGVFNVSTVEPAYSQTVRRLTLGPFNCTC